MYCYITSRIYFNHFLQRQDRQADPSSLFGPRRPPNALPPELINVPSNTFRIKLGCTGYALTSLGLQRQVICQQVE